MEIVVKLLASVVFRVDVAILHYVWLYLLCCWCCFSILFLCKFYWLKNINKKEGDDIVSAK